MAHELEIVDGRANMVYFGQKPWHSLGVECDEADIFDLEKFGQKGRLFFDVHKEPLVTVPQAQRAIDYAHGSPNEDCPQIEADTDHFAMVRDTGQILGIVGPRYQPLQNREALEWFKPWLDNRILGLHTAGILCDGRKLWVLAQVQEDKSVTEVVKDDNVAQFVMLSNSHDGTTSVRVGFTPIRVVCANTLAMAVKDRASKFMRVRHSAQLQLNLVRIREIMDVARSEFQANVEQYQWLAGRHINTADLRKYVKVCLGVDPNKPDVDVSTRSRNIVDSVVRLIDSPMQRVGGQEATWWSAYNAVNEYYNHHAARNADNRLANLWFGVTEAENKSALDLAIEMAA